MIDRDLPLKKVISKNIKVLMESRGWTQLKLSNESGISKSTLSDYINCKTLINFGNVEKLSETLGVPKADIDPSFNTNLVKQNNSISHSSCPLIPILGAIKAGLPILAEENWDEKIEVPASIKADYALKVDGDSMAWAGILPGDIVLIKESKEAYHGQIVACGVEEESWNANLKYFINQNGEKYLRSANPTYEDIKITPQHRIIGVFAGIIREQAPTLNDYRNVLINNENLQEDWMNVIDAAMDLGLNPVQIKQIIEMQGMIAKNLTKNKK